MGEVKLVITPRFMNDEELRASFGLSARALTRLRLTGKFPGKDPLVGKTDSKAVDLFFDRRAGLAAAGTAVDGNEAFDSGEGETDNEVFMARIAAMRGAPRKPRRQRS